jgi:uncharacterized phiE125 gp8 family phage protein
MNINLISDTKNYPVTLAEAKEHLRVDLGDEDTYITNLIAAATQFVEEYCGISITQKVLELYYNDIESEIILPKPPLITLDKFYYYDDQYNQYEVSSNVYKVITLNTLAESKIILKNGSVYPTHTKFYGIKLRVTVGFSNTPTYVVPELLKTDIKNIVAYMYENRQMETKVPEEILIKLDKYRLIPI